MYILLTKTILKVLVVAFKSKISNGQSPSRNCLHSSLKNSAHFPTKCDILSYLRCLVIIICLEPSKTRADYSLEVCHIPILNCELVIYIFDITSLHFSNSCDLHIKEFENNSITMYMSFFRASQART